MKIRTAKNSDKLQILKFCKNTFSWGDYIKDVWDHWLLEGNLYVIEGNYPLGICHGFFSENQIWIEGIRIDPGFRKKGLASNLVETLESLAKQKSISNSLMLIDTKNLASLSMAKSLDYSIYQTWNFYSLLPKQNRTLGISFGNIISKNEFPHYVKSWRWLPLNQDTLSSLERTKSIIYSKNNENPTIAILKDSEHFQKTLIVTLFSGSINNTINVISFIQNYGFEKNYQRLQILSKELLPKFTNLEHRISFHLMNKKIL